MSAQDLKDIDFATFSPHGFKSLLQEYCQKVKVDYPRYWTVPVDINNPSASMFKSSVLALGQTYTGGECKKRKVAEQDAAKQALLRLQVLPALSEKLQANKIAISTEDVNKFKQVLDTVKSAEMNPELYQKPSSLSPVVKVKLQAPTESPNMPMSYSYKNRLQESAQRLGKEFPIYRAEQHSNLGFQGEVYYDGKTYTAPGFFRTKRVAEQNAAKHVLQEIGILEELTQGVCQSPHAIGTTVPPLGPQTSPMVGQTSSTPFSNGKANGGESNKFSEGDIPYKNILQEHLNQRGLKTPGYMSTAPAGVHGFISTIKFCGKTITTSKPEPTRKFSEQMAAREALISLGFDDPEQLGAIVRIKRLKTKKTATPESEALHLFKAIKEEDLLFQKLLPRRVAGSKRTREESNDEDLPAKKCKLDNPTLPAPSPRHQQTLSVGEIWRERKNVVVVGDADSSFMLLCTRVANTCQLFNTRTMKLVILEPGHRIIGLDAEFVEYQGKVALKAERCADIETPTQPDPVLTSCGVVILHQDQNESNHLVLLQRYVMSQPFINVAQSLAMFLRRTISCRPVKLNIEELTSNIRGWLPSEVKGIMYMDPKQINLGVNAMTKTVTERMYDVLQPPLPLCLQELQVRARDEYARRQELKVDMTEEEYHPWGLPKGNFKHRVITTGLHIETPVECAVRELREETGIILDPIELDKRTHINLLQKSNLNPHKGDTVRYFLYAYNPVEEDLLASYFSSARWAQGGLGSSFNSSTSSGIADSPVTQGPSTCTRSERDRWCSPQLATAQRAPGTPQSAPATPQSTPATPQSAPATPQSTPETPQSTPATPQSAPETPQNASNQASWPTPRSSTATRPEGVIVGGSAQFISPVTPTTSSSATRPKGVASVGSLQSFSHATPQSTGNQGRGATPYSSTHMQPTGGLSSGGSQQHTSPGTPQGIGNQNRGVKRRRSDDDREGGVPQTATPPSQDFTTPSRKNPRLEHSTPGGSTGGDLSPRYQSPAVHGALHEECAWFTIADARKKSPVFEEIFQTEEFQKLLDSVKEK